MSWRVVIPFKGAPSSKSRLAARFDDATRHALALAFLEDVVAAVRRTPGVAGVVLVSSEPGIAGRLGAGETDSGAGVCGTGAELASAAEASPQPAAAALAPLAVTPDPRHGLNGAIAHGIRAARAEDPAAHVAVLLGDLPELTAEELAAALGGAARHPLAFVPDASGGGTSLIALSPGVVAEPRFGEGSAAAHAAEGFAPLDIPLMSGLRRDVDAPEDVDRIARPGPSTRAVLAEIRGVEGR